MLILQGKHNAMGPAYIHTKMDSCNMRYNHISAACTLHIYGQLHAWLVIKTTS